MIKVVFSQRTLNLLWSRVRHHSPVYNHVVTCTFIVRLMVWMRVTIHPCIHETCGIKWSSPSRHNSVLVKRGQYLVKFDPFAKSAVGTPVTGRPPHRPGRAVFPHPVRRFTRFKLSVIALCIHRISLRFLYYSRPDYSKLPERFEKGCPDILPRFPPLLFSHLYAVLMPHS
uniref:Uncharacterized protein n=1 Tax=Candidatus Kentrum sp. MB TaxID=2138164 RepID=A0A451BDY0_9GAMM|nr:MAG: hypothetical protein BECKMB1821G_GA0114241_105318 [Candidatus Kentron sp. MB]VFK33880.1 MAG: hypothetical protein BECKMB1821I_GA0114274_105518 [Candidatus Kentron sp. MB]VFK76480.1 MAG: hypothetical protein BECKMB1821H_GA0114242_105818 [Candidatus Kentron sp. MB]